MGSVEQHSPVTFGLIHGAWHGAWCWGDVQDALGRMGHYSFAPELPISDPSATFEDHAQYVVDTMNDMGLRENVVLVGHSRGANVALRVAQHPAVKKLVFVAGSFEASLTQQQINEHEFMMPEEVSPRFREGIKQRGDGLTDYDPVLAKELFYHDCRPDITQDALLRLRPQRRAAESRPEQWPTTPMESIICIADRVVNTQWSQYAARCILGIKPIEMNSGHVPLLANPRPLAIQLDRIVT
jgi:pimeloyl-ACP methyl ester carboxylesterase